MFHYALNNRSMWLVAPYVGCERIRFHTAPVCWLHFSGHTRRICIPLPVITPLDSLSLMFFFFFKVRPVARGQNII